jgi:hypothetical protein
VHSADGRAGIDATPVRLMAQFPISLAHGVPTCWHTDWWTAGPGSRPYGYRLLFEAHRTSRRGASRQEVWLDAGRYGQLVGRRPGRQLPGTGSGDPTRCRPGRRLSQHRWAYRRR